MQTTGSLSEIAVEEARNEITDYTIYKELAKIEKEQRLHGIFARLAKMEYGHYEFWMKYCKDAKISPNRTKVYFMIILRRLLGAAFVIKYLEGTEGSTIKEYESLKKFIPKKDIREFNSIIADEEGHEQAFADQIQGTYVRYISFVVLGLADALVEIAGIHAGSLGIYNSTFLTGLAGIIAGAAASLSMASAAFAQAKQGFAGSANVAAFYTGISYFVSAVILASPYFLTHNLIAALFSSLIMGGLIIAFVSWYNSIVSGGNFRKDFSELAGVMIGATIALFLLGLVIRHVFGITI